VLGDNRDNSGDYRAFGFVPESAISGKTSQVLFSLDPNNGYLPRWRYGQPL
jgi:signal peptidase I